MRLHRQFQLSFTARAALAYCQFRIACCATPPFCVVVDRGCRRRLLPFAKTEKWDGFYKIKRVLIGVYFSLVGVSAIFS